MESRLRADVPESAEGNRCMRVCSTNSIRNIGGPGAGKGTQARALSALLGVPQISTGDLLRSEVACQSHLGMKAKALMESGRLVDDELVGELVARRIAQQDCGQGFVMDGYPRTARQAVSFERLLNPADRLLVISIEVRLNDILTRLTGRQTCTHCGAIYHKSDSPPSQSGICDCCSGALVQRPDDRREIIRERFKVYQQQTVALARLYRKKGVFHAVNGMQSRDAVTGDLKNLLAGSCAAVS
jgi:adenylate kinase